jgi:hypothetical protein
MKGWRIMAELRGPAAGRGYEPTDMSVKTIALILLAFAITCAVSIGLVLWLHPLLQRTALRGAGPATAVETTQLPSPPIQLQPQPLFDIAALRQHEDAVLDHYGWVDKGKGIAHIPIDEAMKQVVGRSLDTPP